MTIITTIHTQRPTLLYVYQFYPGKTQTSVPLLSRHSHTVIDESARSFVVALDDASTCRTAGIELVTESVAGA